MALGWFCALVVLFCSCWFLILKPLVENCTHHVLNMQELIEHIKNIKLSFRKYINSYDVTILFMSVPVGTAIQIIKNRLEQDIQLQHKINISVHHMTHLLEFCLKNAYFLFIGKYYEQREWEAMGLLMSLIVVNVYMECFETMALRTTENPLRLWKGNVEDISLIQEDEHKEKL